MKKILIIGAGLLQIPVIKKANEMGYYSVVADANKNAPGLKIAKKKYIVDITNKEKMLDIAVKENIDGVLHPCSEVAMDIMGLINQTMGLHGVDINTAIKATNKEKMRTVFKASKVSSPVFKGVDKEHEAIEVVKNMDWNVVIKPSQSSGSRGITRICTKNTDNDVALAYKRAVHYSHNNSAIIEEYIDGPEFSVEMLICNEPTVLAVTDKLTTGSPYFVELRHSQPSQASKEDLIKIKVLAISGCMALGLNWCAAHVEIKIQNGRPYIIEIGARLGGDFISTDLTYISTGIDMVGAAIELAFGEIPNLNPKCTPKGVAIKYFTPVPGKLMNIINDSVINAPYIYQLEIYRKIGDMVPEVKSSLDRSGHVIVVGEDAQKSVECVEYVARQIQFQIN